MSIPNFLDYFHPFYDEYSIHVDDLQIPSYFNSYVPDNQDDFQCVSVITPSLAKGAKKWTYNGQLLTIGIYRDEGRPSSVKPLKSYLSWGSGIGWIQLTDPEGHRLKVGDLVNVYHEGLALERVKVGEVIDSVKFKVFSSLIKNISSGTDASYQPSTVVNFYEDYRVFRLLPSFKLVPISTIRQIFAMTAPSLQPSRRSLYDVTLEAEVQIPSGVSKHVNYELPIRYAPKTDRLELERRFGQVYDESGRPLPLSYQDDGRVKPTNNVDSSYKNEQRFLNQPVYFENGTSSNGNTRIYAYDFYGLDINDASRGPYHRSDIISRNEDGTLKVATDNLDNRLYTGLVNDEYGNIAIGAQENNAFLVRKPILPLKLDAFNHPIKAPLF